VSQEVAVARPASIAHEVTSGGAALSDEGSAASSSGSLNVLVVDDDPMVRTITVAFLQADGHSVQSATDGEEVLDLLRIEPVDLLVTDRAMPGMSGDQVAVAAKEIQPGLPVIMLTGFGDLMEAAGQVPEGVDRVLAKPVTRAKLSHTVAEVTLPMAAVPAEV
jgi:CheY-like chemotaxis protein